MSTPTEGKFVWHEIISTDPEKAEEFYTKLFGWTVSPQDMGPMGTYRMVSCGEEIVGGIMPVPQEGIPSHWLGYVTVENVDRASERAVALGGAVLMPAMDIPNVGRFAVLRDPAGACFAPFQGFGDDGPDPDADDPAGPAPAGTVCWNELLTTDTESAVRFYGEICSWGSAEVDMGEMGTYTLFRRGEKDAGGAMMMPHESAGPPSWLHYFAVEGVDAKAAEVKELGGEVLCEPKDIPGIGRFSVVQDPTGGVFALFRNA